MVHVVFVNYISLREHEINLKLISGVFYIPSHRLNLHHPACILQLEHLCLDGGGLLYPGSLLVEQLTAWKPLRLQCSVVLRLYQATDQPG